MPSNDDSSWVRPVLTGVIALAVVSLLVGGVVGVVALGAARMSGIGEGRVTSTAAPSLYLPTERPTTKPEAFPDPPGAGKKGGSTSASGSRGTENEKKDKKKPAPLTLEVTPKQARSGERINFSGNYRGGNGATLQVQRFESGWTDFPVTVSVRDGSYGTYIYTERAGKSRFRVFDKSADLASNVVTVTIG